MPGIDARLLRALRAATGSLALGQLAQEAGSDPASVALRLDEFRAAGYLINRTSDGRYRLDGTPDRLIADDLMGALEGSSIAYRVVVFEETASTNDVAARLGREGAAEGLVIFAETQTAGRGRLGRKWDSRPREGLWFSLLLRPALPLRSWTRLTTWAAVAVAEAIEEVTPCAAGIKWPNDLFVQGRKVGGILIETHVSKDQAQFAVVGIGLNANQESFPPPIDQTAVSFRQATGEKVDRHALAVAVLCRLAHRYSALAGEFDSLIHCAAMRSTLLGNWIRAVTPAGPIEGIAEGLDQNGALRIRGGGRTITLCSGEVTLGHADG